MNPLALPCTIRRGFVLTAAGIMVAVSLAHPAIAQQDAPSQPSDDSPFKSLSVVLGGNVSYDSNLFRRASFTNPQSDTISAANAGLRIDKQYSLQRFKFDLTETIRRYNQSTHLNFDAIDYEGTWLWQLTPRLTGTLAAKHKESLVPFEDTLGSGQRNVRKADSRNFDLDGSIFGGWHLLIGVSQSEQKSEQAVEIQPDFRSVTREAGGKYVALSGSWISALRRSTEGKFLNPGTSPVASLSNDYDQHESEFKANWTLSGKSTLTGHLTWRERTHNSSAERNFSGLVGSFDYIWTPTGKLTLKLTASHDIAATQLQSSSKVVNDTLTFAPTWKVGASTTVHMSLARAISNFGPSRRDTVDKADIGVDWSPTRSVSVGASLQRQLRSSNNPLLGFNGNIATISASLKF